MKDHLALNFEAERLGVRPQEKPLLVALCGIPGSGKSTVAKVLGSCFDIVCWPDSEVIKRHCMELFDLTESDCYTQEGKRRRTHIQEQEWEVRKILGEYGNILEQRFGDLVIPNWAIRSASRDWLENPRTKNGYCFDSVRRRQARAYKAAGGVVIEIIRPGVQPTGNEWDNYDRSLVDFTYQNVTTNEEDLRRDFSDFFGSQVLHSILKSQQKVA